MKDFCFLNSFLCCIHLYSGCLFIAILGILISIFGFALTAILILSKVKFIWFLLVTIFFGLYLSSKLLLLIGVIRGNMYLVWFSFVTSLCCTIYMIALGIWKLMDKDHSLQIAVIFYAAMTELYFAWIVVSYRHLVLKCCPHPN